jgi:hypothetical protein
LHPPKPTEERFTLPNEPVVENQKEEPEIAVAPVVSATEESGRAPEEPPAEATAQV